MNVKDLPASVYHYPLPPERIALHPLPERDASLLLVSDGNEHRKDVFRHLEQYIPPQSLFVFNDTRVVHARLLFRKPSGARIEIFLLEPLWPVAEVQQAFQQSSGVRWKCLVGNSRRWASGALVLTAEALGGTLTALREEQHADFSVVRFEWQPAGLDFASVVAACGKVPLPPYIHREAIAEDDLRYQTVYARHDGSVAAPTAGLHFTPEVMQTLEAAGHRMAWVTLHVGAGTFRPVSSATIGGHSMHTEQIAVGLHTIRQLVSHPGPVIAVGTTSVRTLESLYWLGLSCLKGGSVPESVEQWEPYEQSVQDVETSHSLLALAEQMEREGMETLRASTRMIIVPGYRYRLVKGMVTNFHQPGSTLLMLVAAYLGEGWRSAYHYALGHDFRFLSYGDSCLFLRKG